MKRLIIAAINKKTNHLSGFHTDGFGLTLNSGLARNFSSSQKHIEMTIRLNECDKMFLYQAWIIEIV